MKHKHILLAHGSGGALMHELIRELFLPAFDNIELRKGNDQAIFEKQNGRLAFTTDSYVVQPLFFPGGCIGDLAVHGTINDLAVGGAKPLGLSVGMIIEEGLETDVLKQIVQAMNLASKTAGVPIVTGDTKVVERGSCDKLFINTAGIGVIPDGVHIDGNSATPGDIVLLSGRIGEHGIAIMSERRGIRFSTPVITDSKPLHRLVEKMLTVCPDIHVMRDPTRGGLGATLNEIAAQSDVGITIDENMLPITADVQSACDLLGLDPLYLANEGALVAFVPETCVDNMLDTMHTMPEGRHACRIGTVTSDMPGLVWMKTGIGGTRIIAMPSGELLPRIC